MAHTSQFADSRDAGAGNAIFEKRHLPEDLPGSNSGNEGLGRGFDPGIALHQ